MSKEYEAIETQSYRQPASNLGSSRIALLRAVESMDALRTELREITYTGKKEAINEFANWANLSEKLCDEIDQALDKIEISMRAVVNYCERIKQKAQEANDGEDADM